jgi:hypothetical protein
MPQFGLTERLNRHSQQTGPVLGCSMAVVLFLCLGLAIVLYQRLEEYRTDIFGVPTVVESIAEASVTAEPRGTGAPSRSATLVAKAGAPPPAAGGTPEAAPSQETPSTSKWRVTNTQGENLNMRASPTTQSQILARLAPDTVLEDAGESASGPAGPQQVQWRKVRGPGGQVGWVPEQYIEKVEG